MYTYIHEYVFMLSHTRTRMQVGGRQRQTHESGRKQNEMLLVTPSSPLPRPPLACERVSETDRMPVMPTGSFICTVTR